MVNWCNRIDLSDDVAKMLLDPSNLSSKVTFVYINLKTGKEVEIEKSLEKAILLAESRSCDKRYRNFEFYIY